jgi:hypothetical protein
MWLDYPPPFRKPSIRCHCPSTTIQYGSNRCAEYSYLCYFVDITSKFLGLVGSTEPLAFGLTAIVPFGTNLGFFPGVDQNLAPRMNHKSLK